MTRVVISQPMYFPWPGFFAQMSLADVFIWLDDANYSKGSFTNRIQIIINKKRHWMTIPLQNKGSGKQCNELTATDDEWPSKHRDMLRQSFAEKSNSEQAFHIFDSVTDSSPELPLCDVLIKSCEQSASYMGIGPSTFLRSSQMNVPGTGSQRVLNLVKAVGGACYVTGHGAANYLDHELFETEGVTVEYMNYQVSEWPQCMQTFTPYVTVLDLIAAMQYPSMRDCLRPSVVSWQKFLELRP